jgi:hypothetical protein
MANEDTSADAERAARIAHQLHGIAVALTAQES